MRLGSNRGASFAAARSVPTATQSISSFAGRQMTPSRPYLIRAIFEWIVDNSMTPYLLVDAEQPGVEVPRQHVQDGKIVLNVAPTAVNALDMGNDEIQFRARFSGQDTPLRVPVPSVLAIYARENGQGMAFADDGDGEPPEPTTPDKPKRPRLTVVK